MWRYSIAIQDVPFAILMAVHCDTYWRDGVTRLGPTNGGFSFLQSLRTPEEYFPREGLASACLVWSVSALMNTVKIMLSNAADIDGSTDLGSEGEPNTGPSFKNSVC